MEIKQFSVITVVQAIIIIPLNGPERDELQY